MKNEYIKLYCVEYFGGMDETDTMEVFYTKEKAMDFINGLQQEWHWHLFTCMVNSDRVYIDGGELNYEDTADLMKWDTVKTIVRGIKQ